MINKTIASSFLLEIDINSLSVDFSRSKTLILPYIDLLLDLQTAVRKGNQSILFIFAQS